MADQELIEKVRAMVGREYGRVYAWDKVNAPMIRHWCEVMGVSNPLYTDPAFARDAGFADVVAPPAMLQVWCMAGLDMENYPPGSTDENNFEVLKVIEPYGYPAVVAVNSDLYFDRHILAGERLYFTSKVDSVSDEKTTPLGTGFFVTVLMAYFSETAEGKPDEPVGKQLFRVFKFKPAQRPKAEEKPAGKAEKPAAKRPLPGISDDTRFFWEGCEAGKLLIQRCTGCQTLRHPPAPVCAKCHAFDWDTVEASGKAELYSFVVMHYPEVPPFDYPNPIGLIELDEGVRLIAGLVGIERDELKIGQRLQVEFERFDDQQTLPQFRPVAE
ncbi:bifunctional MaoC family dehydratase N-terminal/OB-fold nucleic acid binding domain-containing protein [Pseudomonas saliphila]|uniref:bifunctional MaoC family dehydratase N-terminal/OB-fold nucleic acid binding domain-containing protein n=1 Tax=Pseudomonas saliphila TaxID=2586906 RepID=UPI0015B5A4A3|nr:OB-fold domain-containing protein [Pseudomonas saliphila]